MSVLFLASGCLPVMAEESAAEEEQVTLSHTLKGPDQNEIGIFAFQLKDEKDNILAEWQNTIGNTVKIENFVANAGSRLFLYTKKVPEGYIIDEPLPVEIPETIENSEWTFVSEAVPYGEKTIQTDPAVKDAVYRFYRKKEDEEPYTGPDQKPAEYTAAEDGSFQAVLPHGKCYVSSDAVLKGYYQPDHQEFFFDLYSEEDLKIAYEPIAVKVSAAADDELFEEGYELSLYEEEEEICSWNTNEKENRIPSEYLEAEKTYRLKITLPDTYTCSAETISFTTEKKKPEEIPVIRFEIEKIPEPKVPDEKDEPVIIPVIEPDIPAEEKKEEVKKEDEEKEEKKEEKKEPETAAVVPAQIFRPAAGNPESIKTEEKDGRRSFFVVLEDSSGNGLRGALLRVENEEGKTVDQWLSDGKPHRISNEIYAGKTYIISQQSAVEGYEKMQMKVSFTMPESEEEPTVTLKNRVLSTIAETEEMKLPRTGLMISAFLAGFCLFALALMLISRRRQKEETSV